MGLETNRNKPWFYEEPELANNRKQTKLLWLQTPNTKLQNILVVLGAIPVEFSGNRSVIT